MRIRFAITHVSDRLRQLTFANQSRNFYDTHEQAQLALDAFKPSLRDKLLGDKADSLDVREVECYDNGDAIGIYFSNLVPGFMYNNDLIE